MVIFHSYVKLPEGILCHVRLWEGRGFPILVWDANPRPPAESTDFFIARLLHQVSETSCQRIPKNSNLT